MYGFYRTASASPNLRVADINFNVSEIKKLIKKADANSTSVLLFPELCVSGYSCGDLFFQDKLIQKSAEAVLEIANFAENMDMFTVIGAAHRFRGCLYNSAFVLYHGKIIGIVPKANLPNHKEFYEKRWFNSGSEINSEYDSFFKSPFGLDLIFEYDEFLSLAIEICEDLWNPIPPSSNYALSGATLICNPSSSNELVGKAEYRKNLVQMQSAKCISGYIYASSGIGESTTDLVFGGHCIAAENGVVLRENKRFHRKSSLISADIDFQKLTSLRQCESVFTKIGTRNDSSNSDFRRIKIEKLNGIDIPLREINPHPFVPSGKSVRNDRCSEIFSIQSSALMKRIAHTGITKAVIGISGGLDSTLALLVCVEVFDRLKLDRKNILAVTMPGFGTTGRTKGNAEELCRMLKCDSRKIDIKDASLKHFRDIGHNPDKHDTTYENVQARERTQILMDIANREGGLVVGTGDLSEIALGWSTYNGDHISMYAVNCGVPKTLVRHLIEWVAEKSDKNIRKILNDIINTPVSPELLPNDENSEINQKTEEIIGPYELHDFFLYNTVKYGASPEKTIMLAEKAFENIYSSEQIQKWHNLFIKRFFSQQFKRSCVPDGPKVGTISLSPRGDWRMPSDAVSEIWLKK